jgi:rhodanese-related sulfurtransferase
MKSKSNLLYWLFIALILIFFLYQKGYIFANFENITPIEAFKQLRKERNITIVDVRTKEEIRHEGKIPGSILIPISILEQNLDKLKNYKNNKLFIYCRTGNRSIQASRILSNHGFKAYNLKGGINDWKRDNLPISLPKFIN